MMQTFDTQLEVSLRALTGVVAPALANAGSHAVEQFNLTLATLGFIRQRMPYARRFHRLELQDLLDLAEEVGALICQDQQDLAAQLAGNGDEGKGALRSVEAEVEDYLVVGRRMRELIAEAVQGSAGKPYERQLDELVLARQKAFLEVQRVWCAPLGLDPQAGELPSIEEVLQVPAKQ